MNKIWIIARREFLSRVRKKTFLLSTILLPLFIFGFYALIIFFSISSDNYKLAVVDEANVFGGNIQAKNNDLVFEFMKSDTAQMRLLVEQEKYDGYLYVPLGFDIMGKDSMILRSNKSVGLMTREKIEKRIDQALEEKRFARLDISKQKLDSLQQSSEIRYSRLDGGDEGDSKAGISYGVGFISGFLIYIVLFIYGAMVMRGVMEEKVSRIAEVIVSSARPFQLMMGKITGIGAVGLVQFIIWLLLIMVMQLLLPLIFPGMTEQIQANPSISAPGMQTAQTAQANSAIAGLMKNLSQVNWPLIMGCFIFYFICGYLLYSSLFAAVGSAVNEDPQDAQSLMLPVTMPIVFAIVIMIRAVNSPNSGLAVFGSLFPLTSPIVMMARVAHGIPEGVTVWQLILSGVLLIAGFIGTTWIAAKIYRTGILLYGKKVTWKEMWKWAFRAS